MADQRGVGSVVVARVQQGFKASGRAVEKERADGGVLDRHGKIIGFGLRASGVGLQASAFSI
jgi:hypothetical protein